MYAKLQLSFRSGYQFRFEQESAFPGTVSAMEQTKLHRGLSVQAMLLIREVSSGHGLTLHEVTCQRRCEQGFFSLYSKKDEPGKPET
ncbi:MAG TPA: hypothetical protein DEA96_02695 [Leptospiraceae bacterium]|nr:hypothetical protein [Spirochaetaceae bacterium]HBS03845.1 hypothetical protein [Leptospiraceae bacterium]